MWHEARRSERKVHDLMDAARKRAQRRAIFLAKKRGDPQQSLQIVGSRCRMYHDDGLYQITEDQQGLIPWNGKQNILIDRFDGRALLDFIRDSDSRIVRVEEKTEEEEELEEFVNFERYRDLIMQRRKGLTVEEGLLHVAQELEAKFSPILERSQPSASKGSYSQVGFSYDKDGKDEPSLLDSDEDDDEEEDDDDKDFSSNESNGEEMDSIAKEFGVKRFSWLVYMDKKAKEEERRQKEIIKGDPAVRKLSRKERRKASQIERGRERDFTLAAGKRVLHPDPYRETRRSPTYESYSGSQRSRSRSRSYSPGYNRRHDRVENVHRNKSRTSKIEYITEFGGDAVLDDRKLDGISPPLSPQFEADIMSRPSTSCILEALHMDPASAVLTNQEKNAKALKPSVNIKSASAKLNKASATDGSLTAQQTEKKETPQERLKRIMSKQLNRQIKKDSAAEMAKKREQERQRQEKLVEMSRLTRYRRQSHSRSVSRSPPRRYQHSRSRSRSPRRSYSRSKSPRRYRRRRSRSRTTSRSPHRYKSRSPRDRSRSRY